MKVDGTSYILTLLKFLIVAVIISIVAGFIIFNLWPNNVEFCELVFFIGLVIVVLPKWYTQNDATTIILTLVFMIIYAAIFYFLMPMIFGPAVQMTGDSTYFFGLLHGDIKYGTILYSLIYLVLSCLVSNILSSQRRM